MIKGYDKVKYHQCSAIILMIACCFVSLQLLANNKVVLTTHNLCPYGCFEKDAPMEYVANENFKGIAIDVVRCAFDKIDVPLDVVVVPWARAQYMVKNNDADGFFAASKSDSREQFAQMSVIIASQKWQWYLLKENELNPDSLDFKSKAVVASFIGANMLNWMEEQGYNIRGRSRDTAGLLNLLLKKRVDAVLANNSVMNALIAKQNVENKIKSYLNKDKPLGVYFSKVFLAKRPKFLTKFNDAVIKCRAVF